MLKVSIEVLLKDAELVGEGDGFKVYKVEAPNDPSLFNRLLKHLQLEGMASPFPMVVFCGPDAEFPVEYTSKNLEALIRSLEKLEERILKEWAKFFEKVAKDRERGKEPNAVEPVDSVRYVITAKVEDESGRIAEIIFDKRLESTLMPGNAITLRYVARPGE